MSSVARQTSPGQSPKSRRKDSEAEQHARELRENESQAQLGADNDDIESKKADIESKKGDVESKKGDVESKKDFTNLSTKDNYPSQKPAQESDQVTNNVPEEGEEAADHQAEEVGDIANNLANGAVPTEDGNDSKFGDQDKSNLEDVDQQSQAPPTINEEPEPLEDDEGVDAEQSQKAPSEAGSKWGSALGHAGAKVGGALSQAGSKVSPSQLGSQGEESKSQADLQEVEPQPISEAGDDTKDKAEGLTCKAGDAVNEGAEKADETADEVVEGTEEKVGETKEGAEEKVGETKEGAEDAEGRTGEAVEGVKEKVGETTEGIEDKAGEAVEGAEEKLDEEGEKIDFSILKGGKVNKGGNVVNSDGKVIGRVKEGVLSHLVGKRIDENGAIWNDSGEIVGRAEPIPKDELENLTKEAGPFEAFPDAVVNAKGMVVSNEEEIGKVIEGDIKKLRGMKVDADGDILDRGGNVVGKAERWEAEPEPEPEPEQEVDRSILAGKRVNKAGNVVDSSGTIFGRVVEGDPKRMINRMCDKKGNILSESGDVIGRAEVVPEGEREGLKEGPFAELSGCTVTKDGKVVTPGGDVVGRLTKGDGKVLYGRSVDEDGDVCDKNGNVLGKAERWEEPEVEKKKSPLAGRRVNREGNVVDADGNLVGKLTSGTLSICSGKEIDDDGDVVDSKGTTIGHVSLLEDIPPEPVEEESAEDKAKRELDEKDKELAKRMSTCLTQVLDKIKPICDMITNKIAAAERKPKEELDEEELVKEVRPLIEEGGKILQEANGIIRGLDPDGRIQANAKHKTASHEASPEEYHLADILKELTGTVTKTIDDAKKKLEGMPHAKKELSPLWGLLSEPLFQILAAVGLLLNGVLGLVGRLLSGLGLGGLVDSLLGGLGVKNILQALGIGSLTDSLTGKNQKGGKKSGGLLGLGG